jgi:hypothetical protein
MDRMLLAGGTPAVFSYLFAHPAMEYGISGADGIMVPHASELQFVFGVVQGPGAFGSRHGCRLRADL